MNTIAGPLKGLKVLEFAGLGPVPFACTLMSDLGASVLRIDRKGAPPPRPQQFDARGRRTIQLNLKDTAAVETCLGLFESADIIIEGNRPGVMERLGLGPDVALARNRALVYGRMTGWGQEGLLAQAAGHDINYIAMTGALHAIGPAEKPVVPLNIVGDFGGGSMFLLVGVLSALLHARQTGEGQVVDAAIADGASYLLSPHHGLMAEGRWSDERAQNFLDGAAPFYDTYQCKDGKWISVGAIEPKFFAHLLEKTGLEEFRSAQMSKSEWPAHKEKLKAVFATKTRDQWCEIMEDTDACFAPVLSLTEAKSHRHNRDRDAFVDVAGTAFPAPAPRLSRTPAAVQGAPKPAENDIEAAIAQWVA